MKEKISYVLEPIRKGFLCSRKVYFQMPWVTSGQSYKMNHWKIQSESQNQQYFELIEKQLK